MAAIVRLLHTPVLSLPLALLAGALMQFAFSPFDLWWLGILLVAMSFGLARRSHPFWHGWLFGIGWFGIGAWWLVPTFASYGGVPMIAGSLIVLLLGVVMGLFPALAIWLCLRFAASPVVLLWLFPLTVAAVEWLRGHVFTGLPWTAFGNLLLDTPAVGWLSVVGVYGGAALPALAVVTLALLPDQRRLATIGGMALGLLILCSPATPNDAGAPMQAALIQGNIPQDQKWDAAFLQETLDRYLRLSGSVAAQADVIIWPESAVPFFPQQLPATDHWLQQQMRHWQRPVLYGGDRLRGEHMAESGMYAFDKGRRDFVGKHHLVPFGEYVPSWLPFIHAMIPAIADFQPAEDSGVLKAAGHYFGSLICYESIFPEEARSRVLHGAEVLIVASNDAWYGTSPAVWQHTQAARARAVESGRYVLRVGNTGITTAIDPAGRMQVQLPWWQQGALLAAFHPRQARTWYHRLGDWPVLCLFVFSWLMVLVPWWTKQRKRPQSRP